MLARSFARPQIYQNITETIGETPLVKLNRLAPAGRDVYVKCEFFNPLSSVKDRMALGIILDAEQKGLLKPGATLVEATSGNTGIAFAMVCAQRGYNFVATMADSFSVERRQVMRALGTKVVLTPAALGGVGMVRKAEELSKQHGFVLARQFENEANPKYHYETTGPEILADLPDIDCFVTGYGTGGTFAGAGGYLKEHKPNLRIILAEPKVAPLIASGLPQERNADDTPSGPHKAWTGPHPMQGWTPMFIPKVCQTGLDAGVQSEVTLVDGADAMAIAHRLAREEGIFAGTSAGATLKVALDAAAGMPEGSKVVAMLPDTMERYLSTPLFAKISIDMNFEEAELSKSTPTAQMACV